MKKTLFLDEYYRLWLLLAETRSAVFKARHKKYGQYLHPNQAAALVVIWAYDGQATPATLSRYLFLEPHSVSELVIRMEKKGMVTRSKDKQRGNVVRVSITEKGCEICSQVVQTDFIHRIMSSLSAEQREQLRSALTNILEESLKELGMEGEMPLLPER
jgi:DNA-binding MarR family transcriptional regulator